MRHTINGGDLATLVLNKDEYALKGQLEAGTTQGYVHWQMYFYTRKSKTFEWVKNFFTELKLDKPHIEALKTREHQVNAFHYVHKADTSLGRRFITNPDRFPSYLSKEKEDEAEALVHKTREVFLYYGPPATGKSYAANQTCLAATNGQTPYRVPASSGNSKSRWLGNYSGQEAVIIDEFLPTQFEPDFLKMLLDRGPQEVTTTMGGKSKMFGPKLIILCNNMTRMEARQFCENPIFKTRITKAFHFVIPVPQHLMPKECQFETWTPLPPGGPPGQDSKDQKN